MLELFQVEGNEECGRVRERLSRLLLDFVVRQVSSDKGQRTRLNLATGQTEVPVLVDLERRIIITEAHDIIAYLEENYGHQVRRGDSDINA